MRAIVIDHFGGLDSLVIEDVPEPAPKPGYVVIQEKAFGINHAEMHMRRGEWAEAAKISGIECVGLVKRRPGPASSATWSSRTVRRSSSGVPRRLLGRPR
jgi:NADPH:quinone reductase-like Zn-dependent oxidoreductase